MKTHLPFLGRLMRTVISMAAVLALAGCIASEYDLSGQLKPEFPIPAGQYETAAPNMPSDTPRPAPNKVIKAGDGYRWISTSSDGEETESFIRFLRVPEYDGYIVQLGGAPNYAYLFARIAGDKITFLVVSYSDLPPGLKRLTKKRDYDLFVPNGARDTLHLIREVARRGIRLQEAASFRRQASAATS
jgi:hypothetical protein